MIIRRRQYEPTCNCNACVAIREQQQTEEHDQ